MRLKVISLLLVISSLQLASVVATTRPPLPTDTAKIRSSVTQHSHNGAGTVVTPVAARLQGHRGVERWATTKHGKNLHAER